VSLSCPDRCQKRKRGGVGGGERKKTQTFQNVFQVHVLLDCGGELLEGEHCLLVQALEGALDQRAGGLDARFAKCLTSKSRQKYQKKKKRQRQRD